MSFSALRQSCSLRTKHVPNVTVLNYNGGMLEHPWTVFRNDLSSKNHTQDVLAQPRTAASNLKTPTSLVLARLNFAPNCERLDSTVQENVGKNGRQRTRIRT